MHIAALSTTSEQCPAEYSLTYEQIEQCSTYAQWNAIQP